MGLDEALRMLLIKLLSGICKWFCSIDVDDVCYHMDSLCWFYCVSLRFREALEVRRKSIERCLELAESLEGYRDR